jgi:hypothetical protein
MRILWQLKHKKHMKELNLNELTKNILAALPQSVTTEELELVAEKWGINPVDDFMKSMIKDLRSTNTSESAIAKVGDVFNPRTSGCYREYLRRKINVLFTQKQGMG